MLARGLQSHGSWRMPGVAPSEEKSLERGFNRAELLGLFACRPRLPSAAFGGVYTWSLYMYPSPFWTRKA